MKRKYNNAHNAKSKYYVYYRRVTISTDMSQNCWDKISKFLAKQSISLSMKEQMTYCFRQNPSGFKERIGLTSIQVFLTSNMRLQWFYRSTWCCYMYHLTWQTGTIYWNESQKSRVLCRVILQTNSKIVTYIGHTLYWWTSHDNGIFSKFQNIVQSMSIKQGHVAFSDNL